MNLNVIITASILVVAGHERMVGARLMHGFHNMKQKKIIYLLDSFPVLSQTFVLQEILELQRKGLAVHVFSLFEPSSGELATGAWSTRISVTYASRQPRLSLLSRVVRRFARAPWHFLRIMLLTLAHHNPRTALSYLCYGVFVADQIEHQGISHVHAHFAMGGASVAQIVHMLTSIPYSFTTHAYDIYLSRGSTLAYKMRMAHFVVTCSLYNKHYLQTLVNQEVGKHIHCIYVGLNLDLFPPPSELAITRTNAPLIVAVSRLVEKKGLLYLVLACHVLKGQGYNFLCRIIGDGPQRALLEQTIQQLALTDTVELCGAASHEQVLKMYQRATIASLPCIITTNGDRDGIPNVLMEALYMQIPVVSTPVSGIPELVLQEKNGLLVPPQDFHALAAALARLLDDDSLRTRLGLAGRQIIREQFDLAKNAQCLLDLFFDREPLSLPMTIPPHYEPERLASRYEQ